MWAVYHHKKPGRDDYLMPPGQSVCLLPKCHQAAGETEQRVFVGWGRQGVSGNISPSLLSYTSSLGNYFTNKLDRRGRGPSRAAKHKDPLWNTRPPRLVEITP